MNKSLFVSQLSQEMQEEIKGQLHHHLFYEFGLKGEEMEEALENGMNSRLSDLEEVIETDKI